MRGRFDEDAGTMLAASMCVFVCVADIYSQWAFTTG